jgi:hypothetical protein
MQQRAQVQRRLTLFLWQKRCQSLGTRILVNGVVLTPYILVNGVVLTPYCPRDQRNSNNSRLASSHCLF